MDYTNSRPLAVNIDGAAVVAQYESEHPAIVKKKTEFDPKNYLSARLLPGEATKTLTIRLLPFSPSGGSPFQKVTIHTVKVNKELSASGWKTFICPIHNGFDDKCPFCDVYNGAKERRIAAVDEVQKKSYGEIEFLNRPKTAWIVRCIERGHEDDGVKFWLFNDSKKGDGVYDKIVNIYNQRKEAAEKKGRTSNIFDLNDGKDLIITLTKDTLNKTVIKIVDDDEKSPLTTDFDLGMKWVNDEKQWTDVYTVKTYDYMKIVAQGGVPAYDKEKKCFVDKAELDKQLMEAAAMEKAENMTEQKRDFSSFEPNPSPVMQTTGVNETPQITGVNDMPF